MILGYVIWEKVVIEKMTEHYHQTCFDCGNLIPTNEDSHFIRKSDMNADKTICVKCFESWVLSQ